MKFLGVTVLQGAKFHIFVLILAWALQQCSANALPVIVDCDTKPKLLFPAQSGGNLWNTIFLVEI